MNIEYTFRAREDLREIYEYITYELLVPETAKKLVERIMADIRFLENMPGRYPIYKNEPWHTRGLHFLPVKNYLVFSRFRMNRRPFLSCVSRITDEILTANWKNS